MASVIIGNMLSVYEHQKLGMEMEHLARMIEIIAPTIGAIVLAIILCMAI